jgi:hypothetical protein
MRASITTTGGLLKMALDSKKRERAVKPQDLLRMADPLGNHLLTMSMSIGGNVLRTHWLVKLPKTNNPASIWLDVSTEVFTENVQAWSGSDSPALDD